MALLLTLLLQGCGSSPVLEQLSWQSQCGGQQGRRLGTTPSEPIARRVRDTILGDPRCVSSRECPAYADTLASVISRIATDYAQPFPVSYLLQAALDGLTHSAGRTGSDSGSQLLREGLEGIFNLLDSPSEYWILDRKGNVLAQGRGQATAQRLSANPKVREEIAWQYLVPGIGYVAIGRFEADTAQRLERAVTAMKTQQGMVLQGVILDLRGNGGGLLESGVKVADALLPGGPVVQIDGRADEYRMRFEADARDILDGRPLLVLIDAGSASAAEIVAGSLQGRGRARLVGTRSYGKGSVQTWFLTDCRLAVKLTTAHYFTPQGRPIEGRGLVPDIAYPQGCPKQTGHQDPALACAVEHLRNRPETGLLQLPSTAP